MFYYFFSSRVSNDSPNLMSYYAVVGQEAKRWIVIILVMCRLSWPLSSGIALSGCYRGRSIFFGSSFVCVGSFIELLNSFYTRELTNQCLKIFRLKVFKNIFLFTSIRKTVLELLIINILQKLDLQIKWYDDDVSDTFPEDTLFYLTL